MGMRLQHELKRYAGSAARRPHRQPAGSRLGAERRPFGSILAWEPSWPLMVVGLLGTKEITMAPDPDTGLAQWFAEIARDLQARDGVDETLQQVCRLAVSTIDGCESAGVSLIHRGGRIDTPAASDSTAREIHELQTQLGEGPCLDAIWDKFIVQIDDLTVEKRWPRFAARAVEAAVRSTLSFQLFTHEYTLGALDLFSSELHAFDADAREIGRILAAHAAVASAEAREQAQLSQAIVTRQRIGEATGILAERHNITTDSAFRLLARASQNHNIKLRELAERLVTSEDNARPGHSAGSTRESPDNRSGAG